MPWFALRPERIEYEIAPGRRITSHRATVEVRVAGAPWLRLYCFVDTGAPFSVVSQTVASALASHLTWLPVPSGPVPRFANGQSIPPAPLNPLLTWWDPLAQLAIPCRLGELIISFSGLNPPRQSDPVTMVAKVLQARAAPYNDQFVLVGLGLLAANSGRLAIDGQPWGLGGPGLFFPP
jgi:hypothetical protein